MSKRIFQAKAEAVLPVANSRTPNCYYHKFPITQFCVKKKCTLPLCSQCLSIHKKEHISNKEIPNEGILQFEAARDDAVSAFSERREEIEKVQFKFRARVEEYKSRMVEAISAVLDKFCEDSLVTDGNLDILMEIDQRTAEIKQGSLKELIRYYEDIHGAEHFRKLYKMYTGEYLANFRFEADKKALEKLCKDGIRDLNYDHQKPPQPAEEAETKEPAPIPQKEKPEQHSGEQKQLPSHSPVLAKNAFKTTTEEEEQSQISSYQLLKSKKKVEEGNIYTHNPAKTVELDWKDPSNNTSNVSKTSKGKKKGLSLTKSYKQLPGLSSHPSAISAAQPEREKSSQGDNRKASWKNFVNMRSTHPENELIPASEPSSVLNPRQMREMLARKKAEERQKELRANRSAELLAPERVRQ